MVKVERVKPSMRAAIISGFEFAANDTAWTNIRDLWGNLTQLKTVFPPPVRRRDL